MPYVNAEGKAKRLDNGPLRVLRLLTLATERPSCDLRISRNARLVAPDRRRYCVRLRAFAISQASSRASRWYSLLSRIATTTARTPRRLNILRDHRRLVSGLFADRRISVCLLPKLNSRNRNPRVCQGTRSTPPVLGEDSSSDEVSSVRSK